MAACSDKMHFTMRMISDRQCGFILRSASAALTPVKRSKVYLNLWGLMWMHRHISNKKICSIKFAVRLKLKLNKISTTA